MGFSVTYTTTNKKTKENLSHSTEGKNSLQDTIQFFISNRKKEKKAQQMSKPDVKEPSDDCRINIQDTFDILDIWAKFDGNLTYSFTPIKSEPIAVSNSEIVKSLKDSLAQYTAMLEKASNDFEKRVITETVKTLKTQLWNIENPDQLQEQKPRENKFYYYPQESQQKREERREKAIHEIFRQYCRTQSVHNNSAMSFTTFTSVVHDFNLIRTEEDKNVNQTWQYDYAKITALRKLLMFFKHA